MHDDSDFAAADPVADSLDELLRSALWPDDASDPLDRLLRLAQWPEPAAGSLPDVRQIARQARRKRTLALGGAAAAVLLLAAALWNLRNPAEDSPPGFAKTVVADALPPPIRRSGTARSGDRAMDGPRSISAAASPAPSVADDEPSQALPFGEVRLRMIRARNGGRATSKEEAAIDSLLARRIVEPDGDLEELSSTIPAPAGGIRAAPAGAVWHVRRRGRAGGDRSAGLLGRRGLGAAGHAREPEAGNPCGGRAGTAAHRRHADACPAGAPGMGCRIAGGDPGGLAVAGRQTRSSFCTHH